LKREGKKASGVEEGRLYSTWETDLVFPIDSNRNGKIAAALGE
jgi:hypothetical protein